LNDDFIKIVDENIEKNSNLNNKTDPNEYLIAHYIKNGSKKNMKSSKSEHQIGSQQIDQNNEKSKVLPRKGKNGQLIVVKIYIIKINNKI